MILALIPFTGLLTAGLMYFLWVRPLKWHIDCIESSNDHLHSELVKYRLVVKDIEEWVELESRERPKIGLAIKRRIAQRLRELNIKRG